MKNSQLEAVRKGAYLLHSIRKGRERIWKVRIFFLQHQQWSKTEAEGIASLKETRQLKALSSTELLLVSEKARSRKDMAEQEAPGRAGSTWQNRKCMAKQEAHDRAGSTWQRREHMAEQEVHERAGSTWQSRKCMAKQEVYGRAESAWQSRYFLCGSKGYLQ